MSVKAATPKVVNMADEPTPRNSTPWALAAEVIPTIAVNTRTARIAFVPLISVFSLKDKSLIPNFGVSGFEPGHRVSTPLFRADIHKHALTISNLEGNPHGRACTRTIRQDC